MTATTTGYSIDDTPIYYELHGGGDRVPLLLIHGGGSTIESNWAALLPLVTDRAVLAVELQGHGHTSPGTVPASFERSADQVASLLEQLGLGAVDVLGFSNGGQVAMQLAARHPELLNRLIIASAPFRRDGMIDGFWPALQAGTFDDMPGVFVDADLRASGDPEHARAMFELDRRLMLGFEDWPDSLPASIQAPSLIVVGDRDVVTVDHAARLARLVPNARLLVVPASHGSYLGELAASGGDPAELRAVLPLLLGFLDQPVA
jgi:pimeloyl-ACP methyl ester carboxylesterase